MLMMKKRKYWRNYGVSHVGSSGDSLYRVGGCFLLCRRRITSKDKDSARNTDVASGSNCATGCGGKSSRLAEMMIYFALVRSTRRQQKQTKRFSAEMLQGYVRVLVTGTVRLPLLENGGYCQNQTTIKQRKEMRASLGSNCPGLISEHYIKVKEKRIIRVSKEKKNRSYLPKSL